jgi:hypothetical protein
MTDAFEAYGAAKAPVIPDNRANRRAKAPSKLDLKMEEKQRLTKAYLASRRRRRAALLEQEPRLKDLIRYLRRIGPEDGDDVVQAFVACQWLLNSSPDIKMFSLELLTRAESRIKLSLGLLPLDDPMPGETSVYFEVQRLLRKAGLR